MIVPHLHRSNWRADVPHPALHRYRNLGSHMIDDAERLCDRLRAKLGLGGEDCVALAAWSMRAVAPGPGDRSAERRQGLPCRNMVTPQQSELNNIML